MRLTSDYIVLFILKIVMIYRRVVKTKQVLNIDTRKNKIRFQDLTLIFYINLVMLSVFKGSGLPFCTLQGALKFKLA